MARGLLKSPPYKAWSILDTHIQVEINYFEFYFEFHKKITIYYTELKF
jgi:hypothetical protein